MANYTQRTREQVTSVCQLLKEHWRTYVAARVEQKQSRALDRAYMNDGGLGGPVSTAVANASVAAMATRIGISATALHERKTVKDDIVRKCSNCTNRAKCRLWMVEFDDNRDGYREFCPNVSRFDALQKQKIN